MSFEKPSYERNESSAAVSPALSNAADALKKELVNLGKLATLSVDDQDNLLKTTFASFVYFAVR